MWHAWQWDIFVKVGPRTTKALPIVPTPWLPEVAPTSRKDPRAVLLHHRLHLAVIEVRERGGVRDLCINPSDPRRFRAACTESHHNRPPLSPHYWECALHHAGGHGVKLSAHACTAVGCPLPPSKRDSRLWAPCQWAGTALVAAPKGQSWRTTCSPAPKTIHIGRRGPAIGTGQSGFHIGLPVNAGPHDDDTMAHGRYATGIKLSKSPSPEVLLQAFDVSAMH